MAKNMIVLVGIPASGKTTITRTLFASHIPVSFDQLPHRTRNEEDKLIMKVCKRGHDIVIDSANIDKRKRTKYINYAREYGYSVHAVFVDTSLDAARKRNASRERQVPDGMLKSYAEKIEYPSTDEGFDTVFTMWNDWQPKLT